MNALEDRLTDVLTRTADAVEVNPDLQRVLEGTALVPIEGTLREHRRSRSRAVPAIAAALVVVALIGAVVARSADPTTTTTDPAEPAPSAASADDMPRILVTAAGWSIERVQRLSPPTGELVFSDTGERLLEFIWNPKADHDELLADRRQASEGTWPVVVAGSDGEVFQYAGSLDFTALWLTGSHSFELRSSSFGRVEDFLAVIATVQPVDVSTWTAALPDDVVLPDQRAVVVADIVDDLPIPESLDVQQLGVGDSTSRQAIGMDVTQDVACAWVQQWVDGTTSNDAEAVTQATAAMASSHQWDVLVDNDGMFAFYIWQVADAMAAGEPVNGDTSIPTGIGYQRAIGCPEG